MFTIIEHTNMSLIDILNLLNRDQLSPQEIIKCTLGIKSTEIQAYCILANKGPVTIQEATQILGKSRSTAQRLLQNLVEKGLATREEELIGLGGYKYVYKPVPPERIKWTIQMNLDQWYNKMQTELESFPEKIKQINCDFDD
ncbi:TrmB family transcriptional regulator [Candidatus Bathyarchaeota archaeon]|nr:MAG: TrmB family transcriptional regulator [Candidatus Bathyarchaeota archaeon]HHL41063.1 MarR family transcriptional regulator [Candidatus Bathyarchaeota archaeon]